MIGQGIGKFMSDTAALVESKMLPEITDIGNASNQEGVSIFLELRKDADIERITNILYKKTRLEDTFGVNMLAISDGRPEVMSLGAILAAWLRFQHEILERKYKALLEKEQDKREIQEGLITACNIIDLVIAVIRGAKNRKDAEDCLTKGITDKIIFKDASLREDASHLRFTERQADAILEMRLYKLIGLELMQLQKDYKATMKAIKEYTSIINGRSKREEMIKSDLMRIKEEYGYPRRTLIEDGREAVIEEKKAEVSPCEFVMDRLRYCKLLDEALFEKNRETVEAEQKYIIHCSTDTRIQLFTDKGSMYQIKTTDVPVKKPKDKGIPVDNVSNYKNADEEIIFVCCVEELKDCNLMFLTEQGLIKQVPVNEFETANKTVVGTKLEEGDRLRAVQTVREIGSNTLAVWSDNGYFLRFALDDVPVMKKNSKGVRSIKLSKDAVALGMEIITEDPVVEFKGKEIHLKNLKTGVRGGAGAKQRV